MGGNILVTARKSRWLRRRGPELGATVLGLSMVARIVAMDPPTHGHWLDALSDSWASVLLLVTATYLLWFAFKISMRKAEASWRNRHAELERTWEQRHALLLAREQEILDQMREARALLGISETEAIRPVTQLRLVEQDSAG